MRIAIDARHVSNRQKGGYKSYTRQLLSKLGEFDQENEYFVYFDRQFEAKDLFPFDNYEFRVLPGGNPARTVWRELSALPKVCARDGVDVLHCPANTGPIHGDIPRVVTVHDAIHFLPQRREWERHGGRRPLKQRLLVAYERWNIPRVAKVAARIITSTERSQKDLSDLLGVPPEKVAVIPIAIDPHFQRREQDKELVAALRRSHGIAEDFALCLGSVDPRKNLHLCFEAFADPPPAKLQLVVISSHPSATDNLEKMAEEAGVKKLRIVERVSDQELVAFYNMASIFLFPSIYEGFGLPPLEAMACGVPVIAANASCLPEVLGDAPRYVDPHDPADLRKAVEEIMDDPVVWEVMREKGSRQVRKYTSERQIRETIEVYRQVAGQAAGRPASTSQAAAS